MRTREPIAASIGPFATLSCEPRQVRKEATVATDAGADVWLVLAAIGFSVRMSEQDERMSYQVLARKWRPRRFKDMVGQESILRILENAIEQSRLHHAYLFTGTRGVGKTTVARILAKCLNCEAGITSNPCGTCATCTSIDAGQFLDLYEIDAASRTKVEDTRELLDNVLYPPTQGRFKIYLIDEVHMLSNHSFNALLKTLEEPPAHVKFLLATTDPKRLPVTILSRCLQFHLRRITPEKISQHLQYICEAETVSCETKALEKLAKAADGSMRDALSLLDQAIAYGHGAVRAEEVNAMLGCMAQDDLLPLIEALATHDGKKLFSAINQLSEHAPDFQQALEELISLFHHLALQQMVPDASYAPEALLPFAKRFTPEEIQLYYQIALLCRRDLAYAPSPQQGFEMAMLRMLAFAPAEATQKMHLVALAEKSAAPRTKPAALPANANKTNTATPQSIQPAVETTGSLPGWRSMLMQLNLTGMAQALANNCMLKNITGDKVELTISIKHQPMLNQKLEDRLREALSHYLKRPIRLQISVTADEIITPHKAEQTEQSKKLETATMAIMSDPQVKQLIDMYDATVDVSLK